VCNRIDNPSVVWISGVDFFLLPEEGLIVFATDPVTTPGIATREIIVDGVIQTEVSLWAFCTKTDNESLWQTYGYTLPQKLDSSEQYKNLINAAFDSHILASNSQSVIDTLSTVVGIPTVKSDGETIESIVVGRRLYVVSDKNVYSFHRNSTTTVVVGDIVNKGDSLVDTVSITYLSGQHMSNGVDGVKQSGVVTRAVNVRNQDWLPVAADIAIKAGAVNQANAMFGKLPTFQGKNIPKSIFFEGYPAFYGNETATLSKMQLPAHEFIKMSFDVLMVGEGWCGMTLDSRFTVAADGGVLLSKSFSNNTNSVQTYPVAGSAAKTGSVSESLSIHNYSIYSFEFIFAHAASTLALTFSAANLPAARTNALSVYDIRMDTRTARNALDQLGSQSDVFSNYRRYVGLYDNEETITGFFMIADMQDIAVKLADQLQEYRILVANDPNQVSYISVRPHVPTYNSFGRFTGFVLKYTNASEVKLISSVRDAHYTYPTASSLALSFARYYLSNSDSYFAYSNTGWALRNVKLETLSRTLGVIETYTPHDLNEFGDITGISLSKGYLGGEFLGELHFPNKSVVLERVVNSDGRVDCTFDIKGHPNDVEHFWELAHQRGVEGGFTLANYLDLRANPAGDPAAYDLPTHINPMIFVLRHFLQYNTFFIRLKAGLEADDALGNAAVSQFRAILPPNVNYFIFTEINAGDDIIDAVIPWSEEVTIGAGPNISETWGEEQLTIEPAPLVTGIEGVII
jgi:hypothetical protein